MSKDFCQTSVSFKWEDSELVEFPQLLKPNTDFAEVVSESETIYSLKLNRIKMLKKKMMSFESRSYC
jgi:hypothetical protein